MPLGPAAGRALSLAALLALAVANLSHAANLSRLDDRRIVAAARLEGVDSRSLAYAEGPYTCDVVVARRCAATGPGYGAARCGEPLPEGHPALGTLDTEGGARPDHADGYLREFSWWSCTAPDGATSGRVRPRREAGVPEGRASVAALARGAQPARTPTPTYGPEAEPEPPGTCSTERRGPIVCLQTLPDAALGGRGRVRVALGSGPAAQRLSSATLPGTRCTCFERHDWTGLDDRLSGYGLADLFPMDVAAATHGRDDYPTTHAGPYTGHAQDYFDGLGRLHEPPALPPQR